MTLSLHSVLWFVSKVLLPLSPIPLPLLLLLLLLLLPMSQTSAEPASFYHLPGVSPIRYIQHGDINIGALVVTQESSAKSCLDELRNFAYVIDSTEAVAFAVDYVNRNPNILPNVTLGFVIQGLCLATGPGIASSLLFIPKTSDLCEGDTNNTYCYAQSESSSEEEEWLGYDVIAALTTGSSTFSKLISPLFRMAKISLVGPTETSDDLSKKTTYPYFFRVVPPQVYRNEAMLSFLAQMDWTYISIVYADCSGSVNYIIQNSGKFGICLATVHRLSSMSGPEDAVTELMKTPKARVVIGLMSHDEFTAIQKIIAARNLQGFFIWVGTNAFDSYTGVENENRLANDPAIGTFFFDAYSKYNIDFLTHLSDINAYESRNPWVKPIWESVFNCSVDAKTCQTDSDLVQTSAYRPYKGTALRMDAVLAMAHAAHDLLSDRCPGARGHEARACINGELFKQYLKDVHFDGFVAPVEFDENHDNKGRFSIKQIVYDFPSYAHLPNINVSNKILLGKEIGFYDIATKAFTFHPGQMSWSHLRTVDRIVPWSPVSPPTHVPESVCSRPCLPGEYKIVREVSCCWECRKCRPHERFTNGNTSCEECAPLTWPDPSSGLTRCVEISPTYSSLPDTVPLVLSLMAALALLATLLVSVCYVIKRNHRVIKASSKELSAIQLFALLTGYSTVLMFQTKPSDETCGAIFFLFCMSFAMVYCPLLAKTIRIFCTLKRSGTENERPKLTSPLLQLLFTGSLLLIQVSVCVTTYVLYHPRARRVQPVVAENMVELSCDLSLPGLASFLGYNMVLVSVCSVLAFLTRQLPDNFNESKFISMCVTTTLLVWLAFIPTYFTAGRESVRVFLLSVALLLNHSVALIFLFVPKVYAAFFLPQTDGHVSAKTG